MLSSIDNSAGWRIALRVLCLTALCALPFDAHAVVDANSSANTNAPADGAPWDNVGRIGSASGVYIGGAWVLTASHVGVGPIALVGGTYFPDGTALRLTNSDGTPTDLILFRLSTMPPLASVPLVSSTPAAFSAVDMIGFGLIAGSTQTNLGIYSGFYWSSGQFKSWGNNKINIGGLTNINIGYGNLTAFSMDFTSPGTLGPTGQTSDEGQVAPGDSGGGLFVKNGSVWQLAGILDAEETQFNQPPSTSAYGDRTYAADIATYRKEIYGVLSGSAVPALSITRSGSNSRVAWPDMGVPYALEASGALVNPSWATLSQSQTSTNGQIFELVPDTGSSRLFRLQKP